MQNPDGSSPEPQSSSSEQLRIGARLTAAAIGVLIAVFVVSALARSSTAHVTELFGGAGGKPQHAGCGRNVMVGVNVAVSSGVVAGIQPVCRSQALGRAARSAKDELAPQFVGMMTGPLTTLRCPEGYSAIGIWGAVAAYVDAFSLSCAPTSDTRGPIRHLALAGGGGGWGFHTRCAHSYLRGLRARSGLVVDAIGMDCTVPYE